MREPSTPIPQDAVPPPEGAGAGEAAAIPVVPRNWDALREAIPGPCRAIPLEQITLPPRIEGYATREGLTTLGDMAARSESELLGARGVGRLSVHRMFKAILEHLHRLGAELRAPARRAG